MFALISYGIATIFLVLALMLWRRSTGLRLDIGRMHKTSSGILEREKKLLVELSNLRSKLEASRIEMEKVRIKNTSSDLVVAKLKDQIEVLEKDLELAKAATARETENLSEQLAAMTNQLSDSQKVEVAASKDYKMLKKRFDQELAEKAADFQKEKNAMSTELKLANIELDRKEIEIKRRNELIKKISPRKVAALKRKLSNMNHLLMTMRGAKELAEEQNANWQQALKEFSTWILKHKGQEPIDTKTGVAKLVGAAITAIDVSLEPDEPIGTYHEPAKSDLHSL